YEQHELAARYARRADRFATPAPVGSNAREVAARGVAATKEIIAAEERAVHDDARRYRLESREGDPLGRIIVPRLGLNMIFVDGTRDSTLERGPGRGQQTFLRGENQLVYIAVHRTTVPGPFPQLHHPNRG